RHAGRRTAAATCSTAGNTERHDHPGAPRHPSSSEEGKKPSCFISPPFQGGAPAQGGGRAPPPHLAGGVVLRARIPVSDRGPRAPVRRRRGAQADLPAAKPGRGAPEGDRGSPL